ncbi:MAG: glycosyltransferase family 9 protein [Verrucomicrobiota bacterium]
MKILIIKLGALGDAVRTSYFLKGLTGKCGARRHITWVTSEPAIPLLKYHPEIDALISDREFARQGAEVRDRSFDWVISLDDETEACRLLQNVRWTKLTGAFLQGEEVKYTNDAAPWFDMGLVSRFGKTRADELKRLNQKTHDEIFAGILGLQVISPLFYLAPKARETAGAMLNGKSGRVVGLNLSAGNRWLNKRLLLSEAKNLIARMREAGHEGLLFGGEEDLAYNQQLAGETGCGVLSPVSLEVFAGVISHVKAIIVADTLALHLAIAQQIPSVSFYAPTSAAEINTFGTGLKVASTSSDYCSYKSQADNSSITAGRLFDAFIELTATRISPSCAPA